MSPKNSGFYWPIVSGTYSVYPAAPISSICELPFLERFNRKHRVVILSVLAAIPLTVIFYLIIPQGKKFFDSILPMHEALKLILLMIVFSVVLSLVVKIVEFVVRLGMNWKKATEENKLTDMSVMNRDSDSASTDINEFEKTDYILEAIGFSLKGSSENFEINAIDSAIILSNQEVQDTSCTHYDIVNYLAINDEASCFFAKS